MTDFLLGLLFGVLAALILFGIFDFVIWVIP